MEESNKNDPLEFKTKDLPDLVREFIRAKDPSRQYEIADEIFLREAKGYKDVQLLTRALKHLAKDERVYERAMDNLRGCSRSIPPDYPGGSTAYLRRETACKMLAQTRTRWELDLKAAKDCKKPLRVDPDSAAKRGARRLERIHRISSGNIRGDKRPTISSIPPSPKKLLRK